MIAQKKLLIAFAVAALLLAQSLAVSAFEASSFTKEDGDWYDNWGINRNSYYGPTGYLPNLANETLNENKELAYNIGQYFLENYPSKTDRAVAILRYVQQWTEYGYDSDNVYQNDVAQDEWAWNADEMAHSFDEETGVVAVGDCEDMAFLCGTIYVGAGFEAAVLDAPSHCALIIYLPEFANANVYWDLYDDGLESGWIWVEATGESNPLGWTPPDFQDGDWTAYSIGNLKFVSFPTGVSETDAPSWPTYEPDEPTFEIDLDTIIFIAVIAFILLGVLSQRKRR